MSDCAALKGGMIILSSKFECGEPQQDGDFYVTETHVDTLGNTHSAIYSAYPDTDLAAVMAVRAAAISEQLVASEIQANVRAVAELGRRAVLALDFCTRDQALKAVWGFFAAASVAQAVLPADFLSTCTDAEMVKASGLTPPEIEDVRGKTILPMSQAANAIRAAAGV